MSRARIAINVDETAGTLGDQLRLIAGDPTKSIQNVAALLSAIAGGVKNGSVRVTTNAVKATQQGTLTGDPSAGDTLTINGVAFTARASGAVANEFNITAGNVTVTMAALVASINASVTAKILNQVKASNVAGVLTLTATIPGTNGNLFTVTESMANFTLVGTAFTGGTEGTEVICNHGLDV